MPPRGSKPGLLRFLRLSGASRQSGAQGMPAIRGDSRATIWPKDGSADEFFPNLFFSNLGIVLRYLQNQESYSRIRSRIPESGVVFLHREALIGYCLRRRTKTASGERQFLLIGQPWHVEKTCREQISGGRCAIQFLPTIARTNSGICMFPTQLELLVRVGKGVRTRRCNRASQPSSSPSSLPAL